MILKLKRGPGESWVYVDRVRKAQTFAFYEGDADAGVLPEQRLFSTQGELAQAVDRMWGPMDVRHFDEELWPEFYVDDPRDQRYVTCVRVDTDDGRQLLVLVDDDAFLLSERGDTVDRLR